MTRMSTQRLAKPVLFAAVTWKREANKRPSGVTKSLPCLIRSLCVAERTIRDWWNQWCVVFRKLLRPLCLRHLWKEKNVWNNYFFNIERLDCCVRDEQVVFAKYCFINENCDLRCLGWSIKSKTSSEWRNLTMPQLQWLDVPKNNLCWWYIPACLRWRQPSHVSHTDLQGEVEWFHGFWVQSVCKTLFAGFSDNECLETCLEVF